MNIINYPKSIRRSVYLWYFAIIAATFELVLVLMQFMLENSEETVGSIVINIILRLLLFIILILIIRQLLYAKNWARIVLTILLGVFGILSMIVSPIQWMLNNNVLSFFENINLFTLLFTISRILHIIFVVSAIIFMYSREANEFFKKKT
ncbi:MULTISPECIES: hypothetical protein [Staphylococcus]|uniref:Uncharacterized protein n=5 Tax=Staphylococcus TaxID=1279 RepID=A0A380CX98_9STAP|nr:MULTISPECIES: hypothetical protein [Staphylococcus]ERF48699.1 hypothetical protein N039_03290 [Staphylococcus sp. EGD-HP3]MCD8841097.1 hypothetical protein [Staphylococcus arlettae]MCD8863991.1 hypothetical protein [Staphylococcus arlettae]MCP8714588.1 hypothetical protein [Staphylococcus arlettae]MDN0188994.1 hypothetical protein [Staphylococcus arlettae]